MDLKNRDKLKSYFEKGKLPQQGHFEELIDSMVNRIDDGFSKDMEHGLMLSPEGGSHKLISFYRSIEQKNPAWSIEIDSGNDVKGLHFTEPGPEGGTRLFLQEGGNIGIGTTDPAYRLHVNGLAGMKGRIGTYAEGKIPANGKWHYVAEGLNGCNAFELVARVGEPGQGRYSLLYAMAASTFGRSRSRIRRVQAHYGWWWNKIRVRWHGGTFDYGLQIKTIRNYGPDIHVRYHLGKVWGDEEMGIMNADKT